MSLPAASTPTYAKIIGENRGSYPYRVGLNTLAHNGETFDADPKCGPGGLYYCELKDILKYLAHGDQLCIVKPVGQIVPVEDKFKTDRLEIVEMIDLKSAKTWEFLMEHTIGDHTRRCKGFRWAAKRGHLEVVEYLYNKCGVNINSENSFKETALMLAAEGGHFDVMKFLIKKGATSYNTMISCAINDRLEVLKFLVENGADVHADDNFLLKTASQNNRLSIVEFLFSCKKFSNRTIDSAIKHAKSGHLPSNSEMVKYLRAKKEPGNVKRAISRLMSLF